MTENNPSYCESGNVVRSITTELVAVWTRLVCPVFRFDSRVSVEGANYEFEQRVGTLGYIYIQGMYVCTYISSDSEYEPKHCSVKWKLYLYIQSRCFTTSLCYYIIPPHDNIFV